MIARPSYKPIGIPYASYAEDDKGKIQVDTVVCPACKEKIKLIGKKDSETFSRVSYQKHYEEKH